MTTFLTIVHVLVSAVLVLRMPARELQSAPAPSRGHVRDLLEGKRVVVVEASSGQLEDEIRLALSHAGVTKLPRFESVHRLGGILPQLDEVVQQVLKGSEVTA